MTLLDESVDVMVEDTQFGNPGIGEEMNETDVVNDSICLCFCSCSDSSSKITNGGLTYGGLLAGK